MYLLIDLTKNEEIHLALFSQNEYLEETFLGRNNKILTSIDDFLIKNKFKKNNIKGVTTFVGIGGFTSTRLCTVITNTFGYVLKIPILAVNPELVGILDKNKINEKKIQALIPELSRQPIGQYISAIYSAEPNITQPKKVTIS